MNKSGDNEILAEKGNYGGMEEGKEGRGGREDMMINNELLSCWFICDSTCII